MISFSHRIQMLSIELVPFMMALVFHEYAHGWVALKWGDATAQKQGRLTLNPLVHLDPIGTVLFPIINILTGMNILFGWAKPVPINPSRFKKYRPGLFWVSLAGPGMNCILAIFSAIVFCGLQAWVSPRFYLFEPLLAMAFTSISLNYALALFNLIPLPPLDGSKMLEALLSYEAAKKYESIAQYSFFILLGLLMTGILSFLSIPIQFLSGSTLIVIKTLFSLGN